MNQKLNENEYCLALTALTDFWSKEHVNVLLGEWCVNEYAQKDYTLFPNIVLDSWINEINSLDTYNYTLHVYEEIVPQLSEALNKIHSTSYSTRYWKIIVGPFLLWYIQVLYARYSYLKIAFDCFPVCYVIGLSEESFVTPFNTMDFYQLATESDAWNLQIFTQIIQKIFNKNISTKPYDWTQENKQRTKLSSTSIKYKPITSLKIRLLSFYSKLFSSKIAGIYFCGFSKRSLLKLIFSARFSIIPILMAPHHDTDCGLVRKNDVSIRRQLLNINGNDNFSQFVVESLLINMPLNFIENYRIENERAHQKLPFSCKTIVAAGWNPDDTLKFWGARQAETGATLVNIQHGGGYGTHIYSAREWTERDHCDAFISWGWKSSTKDIPLPSVLVAEELNKFKSIEIQKRNIFLWVTNEVPRYLLSFERSLKSLECNYTDTQCRFYNILAEHIASKVVMRVRPHSRYIQSVKVKIPSIKIDIPNHKASFFSELVQARLFISDNLQTTYLYALAFNIPTVLFSDGGLIDLNEKSKSFFELLMNVGIYHDSPESAASLLNQIGNDIENWWNNPERQNARARFCREFANTDPNWVEQWVAEIVKLNNQSKLGTSHVEASISRI